MKKLVALVSLVVLSVVLMAATASAATSPQKAHGKAKHHRTHTGGYGG